MRIVECGRALCGYTIKAGADEKGEAVLINMKPKTAAQWTGSVYSKDSGDTYFGTINLNGSEHAAGRGLCARPLLLQRQSLDADRKAPGST